MTVQKTGKATSLFSGGGGLSFITLIHSWEELRCPDCQCCALSINEHTHGAGGHVTEAENVTRVFPPV